MTRGFLKLNPMRNRTGKNVETEQMSELDLNQKLLIKEKIRKKQLDILNTNLLISLPANLLCASIVFIGLYPITHYAFIWSWYGAVILISFIRLVSYYFYRKTPSQYNLHLNFFILGVTLSACLWGFAASFLMPQNDFTEQMIVIVIVAGVTAGGIQSLGANLAASFIYLICIILPLTVWFFLQNNLVYLILGIAMATYLLFMLISSWRGYKLLNNSLELYYKNLELIKRLSTNHKKLQETYTTAEQGKQELTQIIENSPIGMSIVSLDDEWVQFNHKLCEIVGYKKEELEKLNFYKITYPEDHALDTSYIQKMLKDEITSCQYEKRYIHKNGQLIWIQISRSLVRDKNGKPLYFISQIQNINERKLNEKIMLELNERTQKTLNELQQRELDMALINKMNDMLQTCTESEEAYSLIKLTAEELFANLNGGLSIVNEVIKTMETVKQWGNQQHLKDLFTIEDCWALREGHVYTVDDEKKSLVCNHFTSRPGSSICFPLIIQTGVIGMLNLNVSEKYMISTYQRNLAITFNEAIRLSLANIKLREALREQAIHDPLTGLFNRRYLNEVLPRNLQHAIHENKLLFI